MDNNTFMIDGITVTINNSISDDVEYILDYVSDCPLSDEQEFELLVRFALLN